MNIHELVTEAEKVKKERVKASPEMYVGYIDSIFKQLDDMEEFINGVVKDKETKETMLSQTQRIRQGTVLNAETFSDYVDELNKR